MIVPGCNFSEFDILFEGNDVNFGRILQIIGILLVFYSLYFGIAKDSMKTEVLFLFIGGVVFYAGRIVEGRKK
ncbi:MAG: hypothetical protein A2Z57_14695 [Planctomycetes bacterium RIFCSPHIGHO2_12_39_6]|nr:MAG: hypothetical protein A2Z57_14695 [Planctomycetes bacterium RIFCSPHIGHO2_12_39_6]